MRRHANASLEESIAGTIDSRGRIGVAAMRDGAGEDNQIGARPARRACSGLLGTLVCAIALSFGASSAFAEAPTVSIEQATGVSYTTADIAGTVDPKEHETLYAFEYSTDQISWSGFTYSGPVAAESGPTKVSTELTGLHPGTEYWVRLNAMNFIDPEALSAEPNPTFTTTALSAPVVSIKPVTTITGATAHFAGTIDPEAPAGNPEAANVSWHFECTPECPGLEGTISADSAEHVVTADPTGLKPNTAYEVILIASNAAGPVTAGPENFKTKVLAPTAETIPAFALAGGTKALLGGRVNPENAQTDYWFEYGTDASYGVSVPVTHDADAGLGEEPTFLAQEIAGLQSSTTYHFRIVASNSAGTTAGLDQTFTTSSVEGLGSSIGKLVLPDNRAWEQVSPPQKFGFDIYQAGAVASTSGNALEFKSQGSFADQPTSRSALLTDYIARREGTNWSTHGITPPGILFYANGGYLGFDEELEKGFITVSEPVGRSLDPEVEAGEEKERNTVPYLRENATGRYRGFGKAVYAEFAGGSADFSHVLLQTTQNPPSSGPCVSAEPVPAEQTPYCVFEYANGALRRVSITPKGAPSYGYALGLHDTFNALTNTEPYGEPIHALSDDGNSIYYGNAGHIYRRTNASTTTDVGKPERTLPPVVGGGSTTFAIAEAAHGDRALLQSTVELVNGDEDGSSDMYLYDAGKPEGERLTLISRGDLPGAQAEVQTVYMASEDLHRVYFLANNQILAGAPNRPGPKLYLWEDEGAQPSLRYLATLSDEDLPGAYGDNKFVARISPDGRYLAFSTKTRQTGYDNAGTNEIYRFDAVAGNVICVSCDPEGRPAATSPAFSNASEVIITSHELRNVSSQGQVFFETAEGLVPRDSNGKQDVYEYEKGAPHLLSSGVGDTESVFLDAGQNGNDVFIATTDELVKWDFDRSFDAYDVRVNGGLPEPPVGILGCEGDSCQPAPIPPNDETPSSASFNGAGNVPAPAPKPSSKPKPPTRAQKRAKALKACKKNKIKKRRAACEKKAKKRYGRSK